MQNNIIILLTATVVNYCLCQWSSPYLPVDYPFLNQPPPNPYNQQYCTHAQAWSSYYEPREVSHGCCNQPVTGDLCCTLLFAKYYFFNRKIYMYYTPLTQCSCVKGTSCFPTAPPTTTTTTAATTKPTPLCPRVTSRLLNGNDVTGCKYPSVAWIGQEIPGSIPLTYSCNAVLVQIRGKLQWVSSKSCGENIINTITQINFNLNAYLMVDNLKINAINMTNLSVGTDFTTYELYNMATISGAQCKGPACVYDPQTMGNSIDFSDCAVASYGPNTFQGTGRGVLREVPVRIALSGCEAMSQSPGSQCFRSLSNQDIYCEDRGAPVYCKAQPTGETILMGLVAAHQVCGTAYRGSIAVKPITLL